ncbi:MAG: cytochrome c oxidase subunit 3 family protein [Blastocatellia bacterium]|nr:cytochrome c oxidase subunit 3 family protein [Blastocatellia bacterium]MCS7157942.1 cytochrome c oxidase subunit 3 family protein [Blastocatellia bacterium]MCX7752449.1 cytochrome c oxidase subunit 3 family protein [Blastocatellia bacterium]MDW8167436.1 cytochrome c oxidase subunit 3 family protein [Acidobacteriota bacterium]MDW8257386.1 cytochrome c oxidase subunit 3 family protein [Acidobacteriota bacterium]
MRAEMASGASSATSVELGRSPLAHHFDDLEQQFEASTLGMWVFLITEVMFFGGLFASYAVYRSLYPEGFAVASRRLDYLLGAFNTAVLICSSLTMALAVRSAQLGQSRALRLFLAVTMALGLVFLGVKVVEYSHKIHEHLVPGPSFRFEGPHARAAQLFFSLYFAMTGLHALHMVVGIGILAVLWILAWRGRFSPQYYTPVEVAGLYWHFVDIVWIYLFPLLYLISRT